MSDTTSLWVAPFRDSPEIVTIWSPGFKPWIEATLPFSTAEIKWPSPCSIPPLNVIPSPLVSSFVIVTSFFSSVEGELDLVRNEADLKL